MPSKSMRRLGGLVALAGACLVGCSAPKGESREEKLQRALNDKGLDDAAAIMLIGEVSFRGFTEAATLPPVKDKIMTTLIVKGSDTSTIAGFMKETDPRAIQQKLKELQFISLLRDLDRFLENARKRNLGDLSLVLQVPTQGDPGPDDWADAYKLSLQAKNFDRYLRTAGLEATDRISQAERIWKVALDRFK